MGTRLLSTLSSLALAGCSVFGIRSGTEEPRFRVVETLGPVQLRSYDPRLAAVTDVPGTEIGSRSAGFRRLADYIFGNNSVRTSIAMTAPVGQEAGSARIDMTAPVAQEQSDGRWRIVFFMPTRYTADTLPCPNDPAIRIVTLPAQTVAVYRYTGSIDTDATAEARRKLLQTLQGSAWQPVATPVNWFYDPPWTVPFLRRNEAAVPVTRATPQL